MASSIKIRPQLILVACLPIAIVIGYLLANPVQLSSIGLVSLVFGVLCTPLLMKWYHPMLIFSCNSAIVLAFLPGAPPFWLMMAFIGLFFAVLNRCVDFNQHLMIGGDVVRALLCLGLVVFVTGFLRGGIGVAALGSSTYGGRRYIYVAGAIAAYFAIASQQIPLGKTMLYTKIFFLASVTSILSILAYFGGNKMSFFASIVPQDVPIEAGFNFHINRFGGFAGVCNAGCMFLVAKYGARGILDNPWRSFLALSFLAVGAATGYRSAFGYVVLILIVVFFLEGLYRTKYMLKIMTLGLIAAIFLLAFTDKLPLTFQRTLSFLPVKVDAMAEQDAQVSLEWRMEMWKVVVAKIPHYLFEGKGYALDPDEMYMSQLNSYTKQGTLASEWAIYAGDYHNGPLSVIIPFGIWGVAAFLWFLTAVARMLYRNYAHGDASLVMINRLLLACFITKILFFFVLIGGFHEDLIFFTSMAGLAISLNGSAKKPAESEEDLAISPMSHRIGEQL